MPYTLLRAVETCRRKYIKSKVPTYINVFYKFINGDCFPLKIQQLEISSEFTFPDRAWSPQTALRPYYCGALLLRTVYRVATERFNTNHRMLL